MASKNEIAEKTKEIIKKSKNEYTEIDHIREDLDSLKNNVIELTRHLTKDGNAQISQISQALLDRVHDVQKSGKKQLKVVEGKVQENPTQTLALAFGAGVIASLLLRRR